MVLISRVLIDVGRIMEVRPVYKMVVTFHGAIGKRALPGDSEIAHWINMLELMCLEGENREIDVEYLIDIVKQLNFLFQREKNAPHGYQELC